MKELKKFGFGSNQELEPIVKEEFQNFLSKKMSPKMETEGQTRRFNSHLLFTAFTTNVFARMVTGKALSDHNPMTPKLPAIFHEYGMTGAPTGFGLISAFPFLAKLAPGWSGFTAYGRVSKELQTYFQVRVEREISS
jgi:hypothetical protein